MCWRSLLVGPQCEVKQGIPKSSSFYIFTLDTFRYQCPDTDPWTSSVRKMEDPMHGAEREALLLGNAAEAPVSWDHLFREALLGRTYHHFWPVSNWIWKHCFPSPLLLQQQGWLKHPLTWFPFQSFLSHHHCANTRSKWGCMENQPGKQWSNPEKINKIKGAEGMFIAGSEL